MTVTLNIWLFSAILGVAYWIGAGINGLGKVKPELRMPYGRENVRAEATELPLASPASGLLEIIYEEGKQGIELLPEEGKVYAPASGMILRICPGGNEFLFRSDQGVLLRISAGEYLEEMTAEYYRPRVVEREIVAKGRLLLEFDREGLERDGFDHKLRMTVEAGCSSIEITDCLTVENGQDCLWIHREEN